MEQGARNANSEPAASNRLRGRDLACVPGPLLLVAEDRADLQYYSVVLRDFRFQVHTCDSYEEAARVLGSANFGLVIVSQGSPKFEGRCVLERAVQIDRSLPVLVVARSLDMPCYLEAMQLGAVDYLAEPLSVRELGRAVDTHLRVRSARKESGLGLVSRERSAS